MPGSKQLVRVGGGGAPVTDGLPFFLFFFVVFNSAVDAICADLGSSSPSQLAAASSYVAGEVASQTAVQAGGSRAVPTGAPVAGLGLGVVGAAAALAALAL